MAKRALHQPCSRGQPGTEIPTKPTDLSTGADTWLGGGGYTEHFAQGEKNTNWDHISPNSTTADCKTPWQEGETQWATQAQ